MRRFHQRRTRDWIVMGAGVGAMRRNAAAIVAGAHIPARSSPTRSRAVIKAGDRQWLILASVRMWTSGSYATIAGRGDSYGRLHER
ncbi:hypothetical protein GCM10023195_77660 [Actinoallomurus liliacearum]|uniref:Uncharacterized protein n=1 Tax=Actinoallomurus liliacearum TaxID=1080073 RepID=A0ABP8TXQ6_9ACTN